MSGLLCEIKRCRMQEELNSSFPLERDISFTIYDFFGNVQVPSGNHFLHNNISNAIKFSRSWFPTYIGMLCWLKEQDCLNQ